MDNQQERLVSLEYIAGLITGEGCFYLAIQQRRNKSPRVIPGFRIFMNDQETILAASRTLEAHNLPVYLYERKDGGLGIHATGFKRAKRYTETFIPLLTGNKKCAAEIVDSFIDSRMSKNRMEKFSSDELALIESLRRTNGNKNGRKTPTSILRDYTPNIG